jgi:hypothetical protein
VRFGAPLHSDDPLLMLGGPAGKCWFTEVPGKCAGIHIKALLTLPEVISLSLCGTVSEAHAGMQRCHGNDGSD